MPDSNVKNYVAKNLEAWEKYYQKPEAPITQQQPDIKIACCSNSITGDVNDYENVLQTCSATICDDGGCTDTDDGSDTNTIYCTKDTTCPGFANRCNDGICKRNPFLVWCLVLLSLTLLTFFILMVYYTYKWRRWFKNNKEYSQTKYAKGGEPQIKAPKPVAVSKPS